MGSNPTLIIGFFRALLRFVSPGNRVFWAEEHRIVRARASAAVSVAELTLPVIRYDNPFPFGIFYIDTSNLGDVFFA